MADGERASVDELLDQTLKSGGDYPPWWPEDASDLEPGDSIVGIVREIRDDPFFDEDDEDDDRETPAPILEVQTKDELVSTRTHKNLVRLVEDWNPEVGDLVKIVYDGKYTAEGGTGYNYQMGMVEQDDFDEYDVDPTDFGGQPQPKPDKSEKEGSSEPKQLDADDVVGDDDDDELEDFEDFDPEADTIDDDEAETGDVPENVRQFAESLLEYHEDMPIGDFDEYLNDTREFGVDASHVAESLDFIEFDGVTVKYVG